MHEAINHAKLAMLFRKEYQLCNVQKGETIVLLSDLGARRDYVAAAFAARRGSRRRRLRDVRQRHAVVDQGRRRDRRRAARARSTPSRRPTC